MSITLIHIHKQSMCVYNFVYDYNHKMAYMQKESSIICLKRKRIKQHTTCQLP